MPPGLAALTIAPRYITAPEVSLILLLNAVFGPIWTFLFLDEVPETKTIVALAVLVLTLAMHAVLGIRAEPEPEEVKIGSLPPSPVKELQGMEMSQVCSPRLLARSSRLLAC